MQTRVRVGIGGWTFEPWRGTFYPADLPQRRELEFASRQLGVIEINATYHGTQQPASFARWFDETPDDFLFSVKASRFATNRRVLAEAGESIDRFIGSGIDRLRQKLGPIVWQFLPHKRFEPDDFEAFLDRLPRTLDGRALRHVMDVRHESFATPAYLSLARRYGVGTVFTDSDEYPSFADLTADFVYVRLMRGRSELPTAYEPHELDAVAACARTWADGGEPQAPRVETPSRADGTPRDVFLFFISRAKERAPAAAQALIARL